MQPSRSGSAAPAGSQQDQERHLLLALPDPLLHLATRPAQLDLASLAKHPSLHGSAWEQHLPALALKVCAVRGA